MYDVIFETLGMNMMQSMTAFAREEHKGKWGSLVWELRSVNHRYLDTSLRLPDSLSSLEGDLREQIAKRLSRGKVDGRLNYQPNIAMAGQFTLNLPLLKQLLQASEAITKQLTQSASLNPFEILRWPGVLQIEEADMTFLKEPVMAALNRVLDEIVKVRASEGEKLTRFLLSNLDILQEKVKIIRQRVPLMIKAQREKLLYRIAEAKITLDPERLEQEVLLLIQKTDVQEEIDRLQAHLEETRTILVAGGTVGRRLDFLMQELNREANTIGSKSLDVTLTSIVVELKVLIEQMREQIQNIE